MGNDIAGNAPTKPEAKAECRLNVNALQADIP
jgi:hypothetical protein